MEIAIQVVWWIGLLGALILTLVILKQVAVLLRTLRGIHQLAELIRDAARGIATNLQPVPGLAGAAEPLGRAHEAAGALARVAGSIERKLQALAAED